MKVRLDPRTGRTIVGGQQVAENFAELQRAITSGKLDATVERAIENHFDAGYHAEQDRQVW